MLEPDPFSGDPASAPSSAHAGLDTFSRGAAVPFSRALKSISKSGAGAGVGSTTASAISRSTATAAAPSWVSGLTTASIASDMAAADVGGVVTYAGLETLLNDVDVALTKTGTKLTAAEFSDLKTIAANLENGMTTSPYLQSIMTSLVDGNAANAVWTGGAASTTPLGNLAAGATATQLSELIGKWFLGTDLPSSNVNMSGSAPFSVSYSAVASPLFAATGPSMNDVNQGYLGDCYVLSCLAEVAYKNPSVISSMFTNNGNNTYGVRFYVDGVAQYVTVNDQLPDGGNIFNQGTDIWASLAEKAYAQLQASGVVTGNPSVNQGNSWSTIGNGGDPAFALEDVTGASRITEFYASGSAWASYTVNSSMNYVSYSSGNSTASVLAALAADLAEGDDADLCSETNATDSSGEITLVAGHAMSIYGYDSATSMLEIRNPWGSEAGQYWDTTFEVSLATLLADDDSIAVDNIGTSALVTPAPPVVAKPTATQTWKLGQAVNFALAPNTFTDPQNEKLTYSASLSTGAALPTWLKFNATTQTFSGTVPNTAAGFMLKVTATDASNLSTSETFSVLTPASAPTLAKQTAAQSWKEGAAISLAIPAGTFSDPQGETLTYSAKLASGAALPTWLKFNATTDTFTGTAPTTAQSLNILLTATDTSGLFVNETIGASVVANASKSFADAHALIAGGSSSSTSSLTGFVWERTTSSLAAAYH